MAVKKVELLHEAAVIGAVSVKHGAPPESI
jgi:hypothetical protein